MTFDQTIQALSSLILFRQILSEDDAVMLERFLATFLIDRERDG